MNVEPRIALGLVGVLAAGVALAALAVEGEGPETRSAFEEGLEAALSGSCEVAIARLEEAVRLDPTLAVAYMNLGVCYLRKGELFYRTARFHLEHASRLPAGARDPLVWYNLTAAYSLGGSLEEAANALDKTLRLGFREVHYLSADPALDALRRTAGFCEILARSDVELPPSCRR